MGERRWRYGHVGHSLDSTAGEFSLRLSLPSAGHRLSQTRALSELEQLGLIHSFKFTHELSWLLIRDFLVDQGVACISGSRDAVREAVVRQLLPQGDESVWMAMIRSRNLTSHT